MQVESRAADDLKYIGCGGLLLKRFRKLGGTPLLCVEKPYIFNRDGRLVGKGFNKPDLLVGKRLDLQAISEDDTEQVIALENRNSKDSPNWSDVF